MTESNGVKLYGFNNLTKSLCFNIYDVCYTSTPEQQQQYIDYIDEAYNADRLTEILTGVANIIGATILNVARQDYEPQGASAALLIAEGMPETVLAHLDKSHITVHTYPESHPHQGVSTFRADVDVATCGLISPLTALDYLIGAFDSDIVTIDYRVRGFTRDVHGRKHFIDHAIDSIQSHIAPDTLSAYERLDHNLPHEQMFHTRMMLKDRNLDEYLFEDNASALPKETQANIRKVLHQEMMEIFLGKNQ